MNFINAIGSFFRKVTDGWEFGTKISRLLFRKNVEIIGTDDMLYEYQFQQKSGTIAHLDDIPNLVFEDARLEGGFVVWKEEGYKYDVSQVIIRLNNNTYTVDGQEIELQPASTDPNLSRIDLVYATPDGIFVRMGTEAVDPIAPQIIAGQEIFLTTILVLGATTQPENVQGTTIYKEWQGPPDEWTISFSGAGTGNAGFTLNPFEGNLSIQFLNVQNGSEIRADREFLFSLAGFDFVSVRVLLLATMGAGQNLFMSFRENATDNVGQEVLINVNKSLVNEWQHIIIPVPAFGVSPAQQVQRSVIVFRRTSGGQTYTGFQIDNWFIQGDAVTVPDDDEEDVPENMVEVTFSEFHSLIDNSGLFPGTFYKITDFQTIHRILNTNDINFGPIEPMVTFAISESVPSSFARSPLYPQDIIEINWNSRLAEDNLTPRAGVIVYREDTLRRIKVQGYDFRHVLWRRWKILSKQYETPVSTSPNSVSIPLTFSPNMNSTYLDRYREWSVKFPENFEHDAGEINVTISKGSFSFTRALLRSNNDPNWAQNQLANLTGPMVYCPVRDVFILMNIVQLGEQLHGKYASRTAGPVLVVGNNTRFNVDPEDYEDYPTFNLSLTVQDVNLWGRCDNNVFFSIVNMFTMETYSLNNTFFAAVRYSSFKIWSYNNIFNSTWDWSTPKMEFQNNLILVPMAYLDYGPWTYNNTIFSNGNFFFQSIYHVSNSTLVVTISFFNIEHGIQSSGVFLSGGISGGFTLRRAASESLIGFFNGSNIEYNKRLFRTSLFEIPAAQLTLSSVSIKDMVTPQGTVTIVGRDEQGNIVEINTDIINQTDPLNPIINRFVDYAPATGNLSFAPLDGKPRKYGFGDILTGNLIIDPDEAIEGAMIKVLHNDNNEPEISIIGGEVGIFREGGEYKPNETNLIYLICHKNNAGILTYISYVVANHNPLD